ncbi:MAG TPA: RNA degradosome polyphosphate kinase, partial [Myxococcota bacterium]|nr:RNA degradosome polyphosphate kinase [Myxococcota bacterium]
MMTFETRSTARPSESPDSQGVDPYLNPELSLLAFHERVLHQATRQDVPLLERLRFLSISITNLDEFFEVRVSAIKQQATYGVGSPGLDGRRPRELLAEIALRAHALVNEQY